MMDHTPEKKTCRTIPYTTGVMLVLTMIVALLSADLVSADPINSTQADGIVAYQQLDTQFAKYRTWDETDTFSAELDDPSSLGADITWVILKGNHERDEMIMGIQDKARDVNVKVYSSGAWGNPSEVSVNVPNAAYKGLDIEYEDISGDALIVYETSNADDDTIAYVLWNGTGYSSEQTFTLPLTTGAVLRIDLTPKRGTNTIMLLVTNNQDEAYAIPWNGSSFDTAQEIELTTSSSTWSEEHLAFGWEETSGQGLVVYSKGTDLEYRTYSPTQPYWSTKAKIGLGNNLDAARMCSDPMSDYIGLIWQDSGNDINVRMWDGNQLLGSPPSQDGWTEGNGVYTANFDCAWEHDGSSALFAFVDGNKLRIDYFNFTKPNTWSTADLTSTDTTANFASDDIKSLRLSKHPTTEEMMVFTMDLLEDISVMRWTGSAFTTITASPIETTTEVLNGQQEGAMFAWYHYDPEPNVTALLPAGTNYALGTTISVNATVTDNIAVDTVLANITLPGGSIEQITLTNADNDTAFNGTFSNTTTKGFYTVRILANDTSVHRNTNSDVTAVFSAGDVLSPAVILISPALGMAANQSDTVTIRANVTDNINISTVVADITFPNTTTTRVSLVKQSNNVTFEYNITDTSNVGMYNISITANDTSNNTNSTVTYFIVGDSTPPSVSSLSPAAATNYLENSTVTITVTVTDNINVSTVLVNITPPNGSVEQLTLTDANNDTIYNVTTSNTASPGTYDVRIIANDTLNNINDTITTHFTIGDNINPTLAVTSPTDNYNTSSATVVFNFTSTDDAAASLNCILQLDETVNLTNSTTQNGTASSFTVSGLAEGTHQWNISCSDDTPNTNVSATRTFTVDTSAPTFTSLTTDPSDEANLDPNVSVTVTVEVNDSITSVDTVILQRKLSTGSTYTNLTLAFNSSAGVYQGTFNASQSGVYNLRLVADDLVGNSDTSSIVNITVELDRTWTRTPAILSPVPSNLSVETTLGTITISNTGDFALNFTISSDSNTTEYNDSATFTLAAKSLKTLSVNDTPASFGVNTITLDIDATPSAVPTTQSSTGTIVVAEGQPILIATFLSPSDDEITLSQGNNNVVFFAEVENIGDGNASNVSLFFTLPSNWNLTFGTTSSTFDELNAGESEDIIIEISVPEDADTGAMEVRVNTTGYNESGVSLVSIGLAFGDEIIVEVETGQTISGGGGGASAPGTPTVSTGGGGGGVDDEADRIIETLIETVFGDDEIIDVSKTAEIMRGSTTSFPIEVTNIFKGTRLVNVSLGIGGYLSQYLDIRPATLDEIRYNAIESFDVTITSPEYMEVGTYELEVILTGVIIGEHIHKEFEDRRTLDLIIHGLSLAEAESYIKQAEEVLKTLQHAELNTVRVSRILDEIQAAMDARDFDHVRVLSVDLAEMEKNALHALDAVTELKLKMEPYLTPRSQFLAKYFGGSPSRVTKTSELVNLALAAMDRGDYETALARVQEAELTFAIETTQLDLIYLFIDSWHIFLALTIVLVIAGVLGHQAYLRTTITQKIRDLAKEEEVIRRLKKRMQKRRFELRTVGPETFRKKMAQYNTRLSKIKEFRTKLRHERIRLLSTRKVIEDLEVERREVVRFIERLQKDYFINRKVGKPSYDEQLKIYVAMIAEIVNERLTLETKVTE